MDIVDCGAEMADYLEDRLLSALRADNLQTENSNIILAGRESDNCVIGGLVGSTSYGWLLIKILWVEKNRRRSGIGRSLVKHAELSAHSLGCHGAWLDTSSSQAHKFYLALGYKTFGELRNEGDQNPREHQRWFMKKTLAVSVPAIR